MSQPKTKLLPSVRANMRLRHYSPRTESAYVDWIRRFVRYHGTVHPSGLGATHVREYLRHLAVERKVAASTQSQARAALLFLYRDILDQPIEEPGKIPRARAPIRIPVVLTAVEVGAVLERLTGVYRRSEFCCTAEGCGYWSALRRESRTWIWNNASCGCGVAREQRIA